MYSFLTKNLNSTNIRVKKARGVWFWDTKGKKYLDYSSQTLNLNLGNSPDFAKSAFLKQFNKFTYLSSRFDNPTFTMLSKKLVDLAPSGLTKVNIKLTNGGDANESAFKRVRIFRGKPYILSLYNSHLGEGSETLAASGKYSDNIFFGGSDKFLNVHAPFYFKHKGYSEEQSDQLALSEIKSLLGKRKDIAAMVLEPIMVNAGGYINSKNYLKILRKICDTYNISLIFDEVQTAFGWLGTNFAAEYFDVTPDLITLGKGIGFGFPLAGVLMKKEYDVVDYGLDETTYGGHPISCAIALDGLKYIQTHHLLEGIQNKESVFRELLSQILNKYRDIIFETRIAGLIASVEFKSAKAALEIYELCMEHGLLVRKSMDGVGPSLVFKPPIITTEKEIVYAMNILEKCLKILCK